MVYSDKLIATIKVNGKIIREEKDIVKIPFGSEYSIFLKNLGMTAAVVHIDIDGEDVLSGNKLKIPSNDTFELMGFLNGGFLNGGSVKNRFKFIQKTENIINHRGDRVDDGFINIIFQFQSLPKYSFICDPVYPKYNVYNVFKNSGAIMYGPINEMKYGSSSSVYCATDEGLTVKGSEVSQNFSTTSIPNLEQEKHNIIIRLKGYTKNKLVEKPIFTNTKLICDTCGKSCRSNMKFCPECGTSLI